MTCNRAKRAEKLIDSNVFIARIDGRKYLACTIIPQKPMQKRIKTIVNLQKFTKYRHRRWHVQELIFNNIVRTFNINIKCPPYSNYFFVSCLYFTITCLYSFYWYTGFWYKSVLAYWFYWYKILLVLMAFLLAKICAPTLNYIQIVGCFHFGRSA